MLGPLSKGGAVRHSFVCFLICLLTPTLAAAQGVPDCDPCYSADDLQTDQEKLYSVWVESGMRYDFLLFRDSTTGDPDLYTSTSSGVSPTNYDCGPQVDGSKTELCTLEPTSSGWHYLLVHGYSGPVDYTLYVVESDAGCHTGDPGDAGYCSASCTCGWTLSDCDSDSECGTGLTCVANVGADYGLPSWVDVCQGT